MRITDYAGAKRIQALLDKAHGYPRTETGERVGGGVHVESVTTTTAAEPVEHPSKDGRWSITVDASVGLESLTDLEADELRTAQRARGLDGDSTPVILPPGTDPAQGATRNRRSDEDHDQRCQAEHDAGPSKIPVVAHTRNRSGWLAVSSAVVSMVSQS